MQARQCIHAAASLVLFCIVQKKFGWTIVRVETVEKRSSFGCLAGVLGLATFDMAYNTVLGDYG